MPLSTGLEALKQGRYQEAVELLSQFCQGCANPRSKEYVQAQMGLVKAYQGIGQIQRAITLCQQLASHSHPQVSSWANVALQQLATAKTTQTPPVRSEASAASQPQPSENLVFLFHAGQAALKQRKYAKAVQTLEAYCQHCQVDASSQEYAQVQMWLVKAYQFTDQLEQAIALCQTLAAHQEPQVQTWAQETLTSLTAPQAQQAFAASSKSSESTESKETAVEVEEPKPLPKAGRAAQVGVKLPLASVAGNLALASSVTIGLLFGMVLVLCLSLTLILSSENPTVGLTIALAITLIFNIAAFFLSPLLMDLTQSWLYGTRWVSLIEVERRSPETARVIQRVCQQQKLKQPRLGIINDQNPTAFTYGSLPNSARLVVSRGLFTYLDDDEVATVYAHELGHIVHWDFAVMTLASTLVQITYLIYIYARRLSQNIGKDNKIKDALSSATLAAYVFYVVGTYMLLYLSRTREYFADHFAAETTGNPNALSRALVKIAYGILEEGKRAKEPSTLIQGTRALGIYDPKAAECTGTAYRIASEPQKIGQVFVWDMFNPWGWWMELSSTHPLTGKRVRALSTYAEKLGLETEFDMARVVREGKKLNKKKLYGNFFLDQFFYVVDIVGAVAGLLIAFAFYTLGAISWKVFVSLGLIGFGLGTLIKMIVMFPDFKRVPETDVLTLMSDPYASPLRGRAVKIQGEIIGRGDAGNKFGSDLKLQDGTGMIYLHYASRFGPLGNFLFGWSQAENQIRAQVVAVGWFRRGVAPWLDLIQMDTNKGWNVKSYHRFWLLILGSGTIVLGFVFPSIL